MAIQLRTQIPAGYNKIQLDGLYLVEYSGQVLYFKPKNNAAVVMLLNRPIAEQKPYIIEVQGWIYYEAAKDIHYQLMSSYKRFDIELI